VALRTCDNCHIKMPFGKRRNPVMVGGERKMLCDGCTPGKPGSPGRPIGLHGSLADDEQRFAEKVMDTYQALMNCEACGTPIGNAGLIRREGRLVCADGCPEPHHGKHAASDGYTLVPMDAQGSEQDLGLGTVGNEDDAYGDAQDLLAQHPEIESVVIHKPDGDTDTVRRTTSMKTAKVAPARRRGSTRKVAHDSGDGETIYHCPFCGAGQITARSDGTAECGYCEAVFTVQVQPKHPSMPQTINGVPVNDPSMPGDGTHSDPSPATQIQAEPGPEGFAPAGTGGEDGFLPAGTEKAASKTASLWEQITTNPRVEQWERTDGAVTALVQMIFGDPLGARYTIEYVDGHMPVVEGRQTFQGVWAPDVETAKREADKVMSRHRSEDGFATAGLRTSTGAVLDEEAYMRHLAIAHSDDKDATIDEVRASR